MVERFFSKEKFLRREKIIPVPGYQGKNKDEIVTGWNNQYGQGNWQLCWRLKNGEVLNYDGIFWKVYVPGYEKYFQKYQNEADYLTQNFSYAYDKELIGKEQAFDPYFLYDRPGTPNQFHNVALNIALEKRLRKPFLGSQPIQVREGKPGTAVETWPAGWRWSPGRIPAVSPELVPDVVLEGASWWGRGSIEDLYQRAKVLKVVSQV